jgi:hypothetical protein
MSRFFINLRSIYYHGQFTTTEAQIGTPVISGARTNTFWARVTRFTTGLPISDEEGTSTYSDSPSRIERYGPQVGTVDVGVATELRTRHDGGNTPGLTVKEDELVSA